MEHTVLSDEALADLVKHLPMKLRVGMRVEVLEAALQEGFVHITDDGHWEWMLESKTLLAYFCGRMWCGDTPIYSNCAHGFIWQFGDVRFPKKDLVNLFEVDNLRVLRAQRIMALLPEGWERIENIFQKSSKV